MENHHEHIDARIDYRPTTKIKSIDYHSIMMLIISSVRPAIDHHKENLKNSYRCKSHIPLEQKVENQVLQLVL